MFSAIRRTWPFGSSCSRTRLMSLEASPLFFRSPLIISFLLCLYDHHFYYNPFNALREINAWTKCVAIDCSIWTLWLSWEERTLAPPMFLFLCVSSLLYCPHWMQKQLLFFRGNTRDYGSYSRLYEFRTPLQRSSTCLQDELNLYSAFQTFRQGQLCYSGQKWAFQGRTIWFHFFLAA